MKNGVETFFENTGWGSLEQFPKFPTVDGPRKQTAKIDVLKTQAKVPVGPPLAAKKTTMTINNIAGGGRRQTCEVCKCPDKFDFNVPDEIWRKVVPAENQSGVVGLDCFDAFASEKRIDYSECIEVLYFAGDKATFKFQTVSAHDI